MPTMTATQQSRDYFYAADMRSCNTGGELSRDIRRMVGAIGRNILAARILARAIQKIEQEAGSFKNA